VNWALVYDGLFTEQKNAFDLQVRQHPEVITLVAKSAEEKYNWLCALFSLNSWRCVCLHCM